MVPLGRMNQSWEQLAQRKAKAAKLAASCLAVGRKIATLAHCLLCSDWGWLRRPEGKPGVIQDGREPSNVSISPRCGGHTILRGTEDSPVGLNEAEIFESWPGWQFFAPLSALTWASEEGEQWDIVPHWGSVSVSPSLSLPLTVCQAG